MTKFLVLYRSPTTAQQRMDDAGMEKMQASMKQWMDWKERNGDALVDFGMPLRPGKHFSVGHVAESKSDVTGFTIIQADSLDAAVAILKDHPHFSTPGAPEMELLEFLPMPGM